MLPDEAVTLPKSSVEGVLVDLISFYSMRYDIHETTVPVQKSLGRFVV